MWVVTTVTDILSFLLALNTGGYQTLIGKEKNPATYTPSTSLKKTSAVLPKQMGDQIPYIL